MNLKSFLKLKCSYIIDVTKIVYIKSDGHYLEFYLANENKAIIERESLKRIINQLPASTFHRVHRSYILNLEYLQKFNSRIAIMKNGEKVPLSRNNKLKDYFKNM